MDKLDENKNEENSSIDEKSDVFESKVFEPRDEIIKGEDGWLSPNGTFYPCDSTEHDESAKYLLSEKSPEHKFVSQRENLCYDFYPSDPDRLKLLKSGYILVRGSIFPSDKFANITTNQLEVLKKAGITIVDPIDNSECDPSLVLENIEALRNKISLFKDSDAYKITKADLKILLEETGMQESDVNTDYYKSEEPTHRVNAVIEKINSMTKKEEDAFYNSHSGNPGFLNRYNFEAIANVEDLNKSPFTIDVHITDNESFANALFESLSANSTEGVKLEWFRNVWWDRVVPTTDPNIFITVERTIYRHDGISGGMTGDVESYVHIRISTIKKIQEKLSGDLLSMVNTLNKVGKTNKITHEGTLKILKLE
jgi:hypothetical protein